MNMKKIFLLISVVFFLVSRLSFAQDAGQQFEGFNLQGFTEGGEKAWDVNGDTADILGESIEIMNVDANPLVGYHPIITRVVNQRPYLRKEEIRYAL